MSDGLKAVCVRLPVALWRQVRAVGLLMGISGEKAMAQAMAEWLAKHTRRD